MSDPDKKWIIQKDGSHRKFVRIKDRSNSHYDSFVPTDCYRKEINNDDQTINSIVNINASVCNHVNYDSLCVSKQSNLLDIKSLRVASQTNDFNNHDLSGNTSNKHDPSNLSKPHCVIPELGFKVVKDFNTWQKNLIAQFSDSLPDTQLRLKKYHDNGKGTKYIHPDLFDVYFNHMHILPVSISNTHSWFDLKKTHFSCPDHVCPQPGVSAETWISYMQYIDSYKPTPFINCNPSQLKNKAEVIKTNLKVILPTKTQKRILFVLFEAHRLMYNLTVNFINKNKYFEGPYKGKYITDFVKLRDVYLKDKKKEIENKLKFEIKPEQIDFTEFKKEGKEKIPAESLTGKQLATRISYNKQFEKKMKENMAKNRIITIPGRILDQAINKACAAFKSAITNKEEGNTKSFRIRAIKQSKENKVFHLETNNFHKDGFFATILGHMHIIDEPYDPFDKIFNNIKIINKKIIDDIKIINNKIVNNIKIINDKIIDDIKTINDIKIIDNKIVDDFKIINDNKDQDLFKNKNDVKITDNKKRKFRVKNHNKPKIYFKNFEVTGDPTVRYDAGKDRFTILFPETIKTTNARNDKQINKYISLVRNGPEGTLD